MFKFLALTIAAQCVQSGILTKMSTYLEADGTVSNIASGADDCVDSHPFCEDWANAGECSKNPGYMLSDCSKSCNVCPGEGMAAVHSKDSCKNEEPRCEEWAQSGECASNPSYMITNCAKACRTCHLLDPEVRCRPMPGRVPAMSPGDLNETFARAVTEFSHLEPRVLSSDPWVVVFENFLSEEEVAALVLRGGQEGFSQSIDAGARMADGKFAPVISQARTSTNSWCTSDACAKDPLVEAITDRIADVSRVPYINSEYLQVLHYTPGQYYVPHHDYIPGHNDMPCGPRLYTFFLYLSDVEEGGETSFTKLGLDVKPKAGRAVLWPSVRNEDPFRIDPRTHHEAKPVKKGAKYAANAWLHQYNFKDPFKVGCTG